MDIAPIQVVGTQAFQVTGELLTGVLVIVLEERQPVAGLEGQLIGQFLRSEDGITPHFKEVADDLAERSTLDRRIEAQQALTDASRKSFELSDALYRGGSQSYFEALDAQRSLYSAQQDLITLRLSEQSNRVTLYKVMAGGWN